MITLRYAENLAHGHGMVYNIGERVLGTTTPLYTLFLTIVAWIHCDPTVCGKAIDILADGTTCILLYLWLRHEGLESAGRLAALIAAVHPVHLQWSISGMETGLASTAGVWAWYAYSRRRSTELAFVLALLFLLRWDSILMTAIIGTAILYRDRRFPWKSASLFLVIVSPWLLIAGRYYGNPIPVTGEAKAIVYGWIADHRSERILREEATGNSQGVTALVKLEPTWLLRRIPQQQKLLNMFAGGPLALLLTLAAFGGAIWALRLPLDRFVPPLAWVALYFSVFLLSRVLLFNWYLLPPLPIIEAFAAIGLAPSAARLARMTPLRLRYPVFATALVGAAAGSTIVMAPVLRRSQGIERNARIPLGVWLRTHSRPEDRILLEPIGYIGYYSQRSVIDIIGLVSPQVLPFYKKNSRSPWLAQIIAYRPEWCVLRPAEADEIAAAAKEEGFDWRGAYSIVYTSSYTPAANAPPIVFFVFRRDALAGTSTPDAAP